MSAKPRFVFDTSAVVSAALLRLPLDKHPKLWYHIDVLKSIYISGKGAR